VTTTIRSRSGAATLIVTTLVTLPATLFVAGTAVGGAGAASTPQASADRDDDVVRVELVVAGDEIATATLADTSAARDFAALLPVTIETEDRFGQGKAGRLPDELAHRDDGRVVDPAAGHICYWPPDATIAVVTADLGPSIPEPGVVPLGTVDTGLDALAAAGNRFELTIQPAD
jgi:hypothetical protein